MTERKADPAMYARVFEENREGQLVLEDLVQRFGGRLYVKGDHAAERQTLVNLGRRELLDHILGQINLAHGVDPSDEDTDSHTPA